MPWCSTSFDSRGVRACCARNRYRMDRLFLFSLYRLSFLFPCSLVAASTEWNIPDSKPTNEIFVYLTDYRHTLIIKSMCHFMPYDVTNTTVVQISGRKRTSTDLSKRCLK